ncbi:protein kinase [candidate division KSB1 bacterium]
MSELSFPAGYTFGEHGEYMILRSTPLNKNVSNTFAEVYLGVKEKTRKKFAVKVLKPSVVRMFGRVVDDFQAEIRMLMGLNHRYIIRIEDFGILTDVNGMPSFYLITEYIPNGNILNKEYSFNKLINFGIQVCEGLLYLHKNKIIHRDIKPDNILVHEKKMVKIVDFGVAKFYSTYDTVSSIVGAPAYAAPEQINKNRPITPQVDIYSLGKTIYTMITKIIPQPGGQITKLPEKYSDYHWSDYLTKIIKKSTEIDPASRYKDINELKSDLNKLHQKLKSPKFKRKISRKTRRFFKTAVTLLLFFTILIGGYSLRGNALRVYQKFNSIKILKSDEEKYEEFVQKGFELFNLGTDEYNGARRVLEKAVKEKSDDPRIYPYLGEIYSELGMLDKAIIHWEIAVKLNPDNLDYKINLGKAFLKAGIYNEAVKKWREVLDKEPSNEVAKNLILVAEKNLR